MDVPPKIRSNTDNPKDIEPPFDINEIVLNDDDDLDDDGDYIEDDDEYSDIIDNSKS